mmetsp:Transcript_21068/g.60398  ORF Transcript_21068/g.60398 Transcript_21068/m.60398 type:complete len:282 (-) Transcript_21068:2321-3166(-)
MRRAKNILCAVAVMHVEINDTRSLEAQTSLRPRRCGVDCCRSRSVEKAKAIRDGLHRSQLPPSVMSRRANGAEGIDALPPDNHIGSLERSCNPNDCRCEGAPRPHGIFTTIAIGIVRQGHTLGLRGQCRDLVLETFQVRLFVGLGKDSLLGNLNVPFLDGVDNREVFVRTGSRLLGSTDGGRKSNGSLKASAGGDVLIAPGVGNDRGNPIAKAFNRELDGRTFVYALTGFAPFFQDGLAIEGFWQFRIDDEILAVALQEQALAQKHSQFLLALTNTCRCVD